MTNNSIRLEAINNIDLEIGIPLSARRIIAYILKTDYGARKGIAYPSQRRISTDLGLSLITVKRGIREGKDLGVFIAKRRRGARNEYRINYPRLERLNKLWVEAASLRQDTVSEN